MSGLDSKLADEYINLRDETPIDEEWAAKICKACGNHVKCYQKMFQGWCLTVRDASGLYYKIVGYAETRGRVRCLLLAAGIECES